MSATSDLLTIPNLITVCRIAGTPLLLWMLVYQSALAFWWFALLVLSDALDGALARWLGATSRIGESLDPLADKILVVPLLFYFWHYGAIRVEPVVLIVIRELIVTYFRGIAAERKCSTPALLLGKMKMQCESLSLGFLIWGNVVLGSGTLWIAVLFAYASLVQYMFRWDFVFVRCLEAFDHIYLFARANWRALLILKAVLLAFFLVWH